MSGLRAGFGKVELGAGAGAQLVGYTNREGPATGVHDPLHARALVLESGGARVAVCALELCYAMEDVVAAARERVAARGLLPADALLVAATHTHSGPYDADPTAFPDGVDALIEAAVAQACERLEPARAGVGWGQLHGHSINRRRLEDPVDPALLVLRVDAEDGRPLGLVHAFGCHPVVLGPDNCLVSADWPGCSSRELEAALGEGAVALFLQGSSGDVNPLTDGVRARLAEARAVLSTAGLDDYYGPGEPAWPLGDRIGGTAEELETIGRACAAEALRVHGGIAPAADGGVWTRQLEIPLGDAPAIAPTAMTEGHRQPRIAPGTPLEVMLLGLDGAGLVLVGQPGEPFADSGVALRRALRAAGVAHPFLLSQANGRRAYLPPQHAFLDGGYEVEWAQTNGFSETLQAEIRARVVAALADRRAHA